MNTNKIKVVAYIRESTEKQCLETEGLEIQKERIIQFCNKNNYELTKIFSDEGISGAKDLTERPGMMDLIEYCKNPPVQFVITDKPDRLARDFQNQLYIEMLLLKNKVNILFASNETTNIKDEDTEFDKMMKTAMRQLMGVFAELERKMIVKRLTDGMRKKAQNGHKPSGIQSFGYEYSKDKKTTIINPYQAKVVKYIYEMRLNGLSFNKIAKELNGSKCRTKYNKAYNESKTWTGQSINHILQNPFYIGKVKHAGQIYDGQHEPIIDMETWERVNA